MANVSLLLPYTLAGSRGPRVFLQRHSNRRKWRLFGGHRERGESPPQTVVREAREELSVELDPRELGEGWTAPQLLSRLRVPLGGIYLFPIEMDPVLLPDGLKPQEGAQGRWWPLERLPGKLSIPDRLLIKAWATRRFVLNQPYVTTRLRCPILTVDLEEPHHYAGRLGRGEICAYGDGLQRAIEEFLEHLERIGARATFFCVASTAKRYKQLIRAISLRNEVASHGLDHRLADTQSLERFRKDASSNKALLEDITGEAVCGFRAPGWSQPRDVAQSARWYQALGDAGYIYSSSVIPAALIGSPGGPSIPYRTDCGVYELPLPCAGVPLLTKNLDRFAKNGIYRRPSRVWRGGIGLPYSGGLFLRCLGVRLARLILSYHLKKRGYAMLYVHPGELSGHDAAWITGLDRRYLNLFERWRMGFRTRRLKSRFFSLVANCSGCTVMDFLAERSRSYERSQASAAR